MIFFSETYLHKIFKWKKRVRENMKALTVKSINIYPHKNLSYLTDAMHVFLKSSAENCNILWNYF